MQTINKISRFAFYYQNEGLLFQFLLHECLCLHRTLSENPSAEVWLNFTGVVKGYAVRHLECGRLSMLHHYCHLFIAHFTDSTTPLHNHLIQSLEKTYNVAIDIFYEKEELKQHDLYVGLKNEIAVFMELLFKKLDDYKEDPSVLYFLLRHQEQFEMICNQPIIKKAFALFFPEGAQQAQVFLTTHFSKKGFEYVIPAVEAQFKKWKAPHA